MATDLKPSRYVQEFEVDGKLLLANLLWRTEELLSPAESEWWRTNRADAKILDSGTSSLVNRLKSANMLISADFEELRFIDETYTANRFSPQVLGLTIAPTIDCNFACVYCYEDKRPGRMTAAVEDQLIDYVRREIPGKTKFSVTWYGGEPLLCRDTILRLSRSFIEESNKNGTYYNSYLVTNGLLLDSKMASELAELGHWTSVQITIDGAGEAHDLKRPTKGGRPTYRRVLNNLISACDVLPMTLRMNVDLLNPSACHLLLEELASNGVAPRMRVYFAPIHPFGKGCRDISDKGEVKVGNNSEFAGIEPGLLRHASDLGFKTRPIFEGPWLQQCQAVSSHSYVVEPDGSLQRCWIEVGEDDKRVGHISEPVEFSGQNNMRWMKFNPARDDPCRSCEVLPVCFGGCPHRHIDGAPMEYTCGQIRFNAKDRVVAEYCQRNGLQKPETARPWTSDDMAPNRASGMPLTTLEALKSTLRER